MRSRVPKGFEWSVQMAGRKNRRGRAMGGDFNARTGGEGGGWMEESVGLWRGSRARDGQRRENATGYDRKMWVGNFQWKVGRG